jgi:hypothetical protein
MVQFLFVLSLASSSPAPTTAAEKATSAALKLLDNGPAGEEIGIYDPARVAKALDVERACAFVVPSSGSKMIYLSAECPALRAAVQSSAFGMAALAAVIAHERAHLNGADEEAARRVEADTFGRIAFRLRLDPRSVLEYRQRLMLSEGFALR